MHLIKQNCSIPVFHFKTNLELQNIHVVTKVVMERIIDLDFSKASCPVYIPMVALRNCKPTLFCILPDFFNACLKGSCFPQSLVSLIFGPHN